MGEPCVARLGRQESDARIREIRHWQVGQSACSEGGDAVLAPREVIGGERGIRTLDGLLTHTPLAGERLQPLGHLSVRTWHFSRKTRARVQSGWRVGGLVGRWIRVRAPVTAPVRQITAGCRLGRASAKSSASQSRTFPAGLGGLRWRSSTLRVRPMLRGALTVEAVGRGLGCWIRGAERACNAGLCRERPGGPGGRGGEGWAVRRAAYRGPRYSGLGLIRARAALRCVDEGQAWVRWGRRATAG